MSWKTTTILLALFCLVIECKSQSNAYQFEIGVSPVLLAGGFIGSNWHSRSNRFSYGAQLGIQTYSHRNSGWLSVGIPFFGVLNYFPFKSKEEDRAKGFYVHTGQGLATAIASDEPLSLASFHRMGLGTKGKTVNTGVFIEFYSFVLPEKLGFTGFIGTAGIPNLSLEVSFPIGTKLKAN